MISELKLFVIIYILLRRRHSSLINMASSHAGVYPTNRHSMDFGKFYQTSYLDMNGNIVKKSSQSSPNLQPLSRFHRPENFSYKKAPPKFGKTKKSGMLDLLKGNNPQPPTRRARSTDAPKVSEQDADTEAIIKLSHYPSAQVKKDTQPAIEREDWPAPPATAIVTKNMVRTSFSKKYEDKNSDSEEEPIVDPKIQKELEEVAKIQDSAMVRCIREDVAEQIQHDKKKLLDPRSASRTPSANKEPIQPTRFTSPFNASPSRSLVERPRFISDSEASRSLKHNGTDRPAVVHGSSTSHKYRVKPGYSFGYVSKSLSTVPPGTPGAYVYVSIQYLVIAI
ncbi:ABLIM3 [Bugula neritina]|uniref:ABLIM3 n=1 Tax=Bugula neritina TaxID=10212 RepID=A0A7J7KTJ6_BUGNE|nr:ABLIM3 [Bugula neritina]